MKGTPELKAKGIIIANNKQVSNFTKPSLTSQQLYDNKAVSGSGGASEGTLIGNLSNQNIFYQKQKQTSANFNPKAKVGQSISQNQWFAQQQQQ